MVQKINHPLKVAETEMAFHQLTKVGRVTVVVAQVVQEAQAPLAAPKVVVYMNQHQKEVQLLKTNRQAAILTFNLTTREVDHASMACHLSPKQCKTRWA